MRYLLPILVLMIWAVNLKAQVHQGDTLTFTSHIAPIIFQHCTPCHSPGGLRSQTPLMSYSDVYRMRHTVAFKVNSEEMPPWPPDPAYSRFTHERSLSLAERTAIVNWVNRGAQSGDTNRLTRPITKPVVRVPKPQPDLVVSMQQSWQHTGNGQDGYRVFVIPYEIPANKYLLAAEFKPGNPQIVHHAIVALDTTMQGPNRDAQSPGYGYHSNGTDFSFVPTADNYVLWVPGAQPSIFPPNIGREFYKKGFVLLQVHYAPTNISATDSSSIEFYFADLPVTRPVTVAPISVMHLMNPPFLIPRNQVKTFTARVRIPTDLSLLEIGAHCHYLGKEWEVWNVSETGDTIKLLKIPHWDFHWQGGYTFPHPVKLPARSYLYARCTYDNTANNTHNPTIPPRDVTWGSSSHDEMFAVYINFITYQAGDDTISLGPTPRDLFTPGGVPRAFDPFAIPYMPSRWVRPPFDGILLANQLHVYYTSMANTNASFEVLDVDSNVVATMPPRWVRRGMNSFVFPQGAVPAAHLLKVSGAGVLPEIITIKQ